MPANNIEIAAILNQMADLMEIATLPVPELHDPPHYPIDHPDLGDVWVGLRARARPDRGADG